jgi:DNA relaxase NicK
MSITFRVHWLSATVWGDKYQALNMWRDRFEQYLGPLLQVGHGGRGFKSIHKALLEARLYADPITQLSIGDNPYFSFEFPGSACDALPDTLIQEFIVLLDGHYRASFTRLDLAWDGVEFSPEQVKRAVDLEQVRSYLRRRSLKYTISPYELREDGQLGTTSLRLGSGQSDRMLRVYDKHGPVRIELQTRNERADLVARDVLKKSPSDWLVAALGHLRDYVDFVGVENQQLLAWWAGFVNETERSEKIISDARTIELSRLVGWMTNQGSAVLSVIADAIGEQAIEALVKYGRQKRGSKYNALLLAAKQGTKLDQGGWNEH